MSTWFVSTVGQLVKLRPIGNRPSGGRYHDLRRSIPITVALMAFATTGSLCAQEPSIADRYLTAIARQTWTSRDATIASIRTPAEVEQRQQFVRAKLVELLGGFPERNPLNARITGSFARDGYRVEKLIFESRPKFYVTADVYVPTAGHAPYPAVLGVAGHSDASKADPVYQRGWIALAKRGYLVVAFDPPGQGERSQYFDPELGRSRVGIGTPEHSNAGLQCILAGSNLAQYVVWDGIRAVDYLLTRGDVDPKRLAVAGNSGGGMQAAYLAALEPRLAAAAPSCFLTTSEKLWTDLGPQDAEQNIIGSLAAGLDLKDFALAFAPRPFQFLTATRDFFPIVGAHEAFAEARHIYEIMGHAERVNFFEYDDTHGWSQPRREATYRWFQKWLNDQPLDEGAETQFDVEPEPALWATPTGQLETSLKGETVQSLNAQLAERLAKQRPKLSGDALKRAIASRIGVPLIREPRVPAVAHLGEEGRDGYRIEKLTLETESGVRIPARLCIPSSGPALMPAVLYVNPNGGRPDADIEALARAGQIVLAPDLRGWDATESDRAARPPHTSLYRTSMRAMLVGRTMPGMQSTDLLGAFDYLASLPNVDAARIGLFAKGNAIAVALYAAALEPGIRKVICEGGPVSYLEIVRERFHGEIADLIVPGVLQSFDLPEVAAAISPRALWIVNPRMPSGAREAPAIAAAQYNPAQAANFRLLERPAGWPLAKFYGPWLAR
jgi:cephalosporin-C deacetylase-like acetyl esterase